MRRVAIRRGDAHALVLDFELGDAKRSCVTLERYRLVDLLPAR